MTSDSDLENSKGDYSCSDFNLTSKLRSEDPDQFHTLVRMHLSFDLDLNTDETDSTTEEKPKFYPLKWTFPALSKKMKNAKGTVEGVALTEDVLHQIYQLIEFLSIEENITQEGIFRKSGSNSRQQELKLMLNNGNAIDFTNGQFSVHDCASVLKYFLAELPEPLLTEIYHPAYCQIAETLQQSTNRLLRSIQLLLLLLPIDNYLLFKKIIKLLYLTSSHQKNNKMCSNNLATLFTPHLLCPRKLSPEALHTNAAILSKIVVFMIDHGLDIFEIPDTLATDVKAYWAKKERKLKSPVKETTINDSIMDSSAVNTVFTFVDREKTAQENTVNATEAALAQLYAYIQSLPESSKKRRLVKQFNKENGHGTPAVVAKQTPVLTNSTTRSFGDSIKRHIFSKGNKNANKLHHLPPKAKVKLNLDSKHHTSSSVQHNQLIPPSLKQDASTRNRLVNVKPMPDLNRLYNNDDQWRSDESSEDEFCSPFFATPTRSKLVETMLTPRSRKPVIALSGTNLCHLPSFQSPLLPPMTSDDLLTATVDLSFAIANDTEQPLINKFDEDDEKELCYTEFEKPYSPSINKEVRETLNFSEPDEKTYFSIIDNETNFMCFNEPTRKQTKEEEEVMCFTESSRKRHSLSDKNDNEIVTKKCLLDVPINETAL